MTNNNRNLESILYVDDEQENLTGLKFSFYKDFTVHTAINEKSAWQVLDNNLIKVVISDQRMPEISGIQLLKKIRKKYPSIILILMTGYTDLQAIVDAINEIGIYKYIAKPWEKEDVKLIINNAIKSYNLEYENKKLIADLKKAKEQAEESDKLKTAFLTNISHEIRTPLNALLGFVNIIISDNPENERYKTFFSYISDASQELLSLIQRIVELAEIQSNKIELKIEKINLHSFLNEIRVHAFKYSEFLKNEKINFQLIFAKSEGIIFQSDKSILSEILKNIIDNAIKFTPEGKISLKYELKNEKIIFIVYDTGIGIRKDDLPFIYDRFWKASYKDKLHRGLGIGLTIVKNHIVAIGGTIEVKSKENEYTQFTIEIPRYLEAK